MTSSPSPRTGLQRAKNLNAPLDAELQRVLAHWDVDDAFNEDLESLMFEVEPLPAAELDCHNPWFTVIAMNGGGSAYGLYLHPAALSEGVAPWAFWEHENDVITALASTTTEFFSGFLREAETWVDDGELLTRVRASLGELGMVCSPSGPALAYEKGAPWLPPLESELQPVQHYLDLATADSAADSVTAEQGLLGHASREQDESAKLALLGMYNAHGWALPGNGFEF